MTEARSPDGESARPRSGHLTVVAQRLSVVFGAGSHVVLAADATADTSRTDLVKGLLPRGPGFISGGSTAGKTQIMVDLACHLALGWPYLGRRTKRSPVVYVATEDGIGTRHRFLAWCQRYGVDRNDLDVVFADADFNLADADQVAGLIAALQECAEEGVVVFDTLANVCPGLDLNSSRDAGLAMASLNHIFRVSGWVPIALHHPTKKEGTRSAGLGGAGQFFNRAEFSLGVTKSQTTGLMTLTAEKLKNLGLVGDVAHFKTDPQALGVDDEGDEIFAPVAVLVGHAGAVRDGAASAAKPKRAPLQGERLNALLNIVAAKAGADGFIDAEVLRSSFYAASAMSAATEQAAKRQAFNRAKADAFNAGLLELDPSDQQRFRLAPRDSVTKPSNRDAVTRVTRGEPERDERDNPLPPTGEGVTATRHDNVLEFDLIKLRLDGVRPFPLGGAGSDHTGAAA